jgi:hypothetical protein
MLTHRLIVFRFSAAGGSVFSAASGRERPVKSYEKLIVSAKLIRRFVVVLVLVLEAFESLSISRTRTSTTTRTI